MICLAISLLIAVQAGPSELNRCDQLVDGVRRLAPNIDEVTASLHAAGARLAGWMTGTEPELLLAMVDVESRFRPEVVSRPTRHKRFCGVLQVYAPTNAACDRVQNLAEGYLAGAQMLRAWLSMARGDLTRGLNGYGCGMYGLDHGCRRYADRVLARRAVMIRSGT